MWSQFLCYRKALFRSSDTRDNFTLTNQLNRCLDGSLQSTMQPNEQKRLLVEMDAELGGERRKKLLVVAGQQDDGIMALNPELFLDQNGNEVSKFHQSHWAKQI